MTRADYIRWAAALLLPHCRPADDPSRLDLDRAITWAEALDARLAARGYPAADAAAAAVRAEAVLAAVPGGADAAPAEGTADRCAAAGGRAEARPTSAPRKRGRPRADGSLSAYDRLPAEQRAALDRVRAAYRLAQDREGAAVAWALLAPSAELARQIEQAAAADARGCPPGGATYASGVARLYLGRWLNRRRWADQAAAPGAAPGPDAAEAERRARLRCLHSERAALERQIECMRRVSADTGALEGQLARVRAALEAEA